MTADPNGHAQPLVVEVAVSNLTQGMNIGVFGLLCFEEPSGCVSNCVGSRNIKRGSLGPIWAVVPQKKSKASMAQYASYWNFISFVDNFINPLQLITATIFLV